MGTPSLDLSSCSAHLFSLNNNFFQELDQEFLTALHGRLSTILRPKMSAIFEDKIEDFDLVTKLNKLDEITSSTQRSTSHTAWRPPVTSTVERSQAGQDLVVANSCLLYTSPSPRDS